MGSGKRWVGEEGGGTGDSRSEGSAGTLQGAVPIEQERRRRWGVGGTLGNGRKHMVFPRNRIVDYSH